MNSYNPKTTFGEHQFFVYIKAQDAVIVYLPIVPVQLGDIEVTVRAITLMARDKVTRVLHVEVRALNDLVLPVCNLVMLIFDIFIYRYFLKRENLISIFENLDFILINLSIYSLKVLIRRYWFSNEKVSAYQQIYRCLHVRNARKYHTENQISQ